MGALGCKEGLAQILNVWGGQGDWGPRHSGPESSLPGHPDTGGPPLLQEVENSHLNPQGEGACVGGGSPRSPPWQCTLTTVKVA